MDPQSLPATDTEGFLLDLTLWDLALATYLATTEELSLTPAREELILFLRDFYQEYQHIPKMRALVKAMALSLGTDKGNSPYFYQLFPEGLKQACKIAGLPKPPHCI